MKENQGEQAPARAERWLDLVPDVAALADALVDDTTEETHPISEDEAAGVLEGGPR